MSEDPSQLNIAALAAIGDLIVDLLSTEYDEVEILSAIEDVKLRFAWQSAAHCLVYSRSTGKWADGQIVDIIIDDATNKEWVIVHSLKKKKQIQRFSAGLLPIGLDEDYQINAVIIERILSELRMSKNMVRRVYSG